VAITRTLSPGLRLTALSHLARTFFFPAKAGKPQMLDLDLAVTEADLARCPRPTAALMAFVSFIGFTVGAMADAVRKISFALRG
jgi:hypothetical protein